ncbi:hypothetical protein Hdeb2414_s0012g00379261 [Helianthus debilis subsp. tardiflorus]
MLLDCMFMLLCSPMISPKRKPNVKEIEGTVKKKKIKQTASIWGRMDENNRRNKREENAGAGVRLETRTRRGWAALID